ALSFPERMPDTSARSAVAACASAPDKQFLFLLKYVFPCAADCARKHTGLAFNLQSISQGSSPAPCFSSRRDVSCAHWPDPDSPATPGHPKCSVFHRGARELASMGNVYASQTSPLRVSKMKPWKNSITFTS